MLRRRVVLFCAVLAVLAAVLGWSATLVWRELGALRAHFTTAEFESFRIAGELQSRVLDLDSALLAFDAGDAREWDRYRAGSDRLNEWIDLQREALRTDRERRLLRAIDAEFDRYRALAETIRHARTEAPEQGGSHVRQVEKAGRAMFTLAAQLAEAHRSALGDLLVASQRSLQRLEALFCAGFVLAGGVVVRGAQMLFHEKIAPLRRQLVEVQAIADRQEKLASLGVLAAGVAHEIRNPLTAIKLRAYLLRQDFAEGTSRHADVVVIDNEINRLERIVNEFLLFARPGDPELAPTTPGALFNEAIALLAPEMAKREIILSAEPDGVELPLRADPQQLQQVLINLIRNAAESIDRSGRITLRARRGTETLAGRVQPVATIEIEDTGGGIPPEVQARLFDPFFTTKPTGTGLGLSIAMRILEKHGGTLQFQSAPGTGAIFGMVLPLAVEDALLKSVAVPATSVALRHA